MSFIKKHEEADKKKKANKKIDILGKDPLVVMSETKESGVSNFGEFLRQTVEWLQGFQHI